MAGKNIDDDRWWKAQSEHQRHPELQMVCWGIATGLKLAKEDFRIPGASQVGFSGTLN